MIFWLRPVKREGSYHYPQSIAKVRTITPSPTRWFVPLPPVQREGSYHYSQSNAKVRTITPSQTRRFVPLPPVKREGSYHYLQSNAKVRTRAKQNVLIATTVKFWIHRLGHISLFMFREVGGEMQLNEPGRQTLSSLGGCSPVRIPSMQNAILTDSVLREKQPLIALGSKPGGV